MRPEAVRIAKRNLIHAAASIKIFIFVVDDDVKCNRLRFPCKSRVFLIKKLPSPGIFSILQVLKITGEIFIMEYQQIITFAMEIIGTIAFAVSGAMVGVKRNMDIFGVAVLGVVTSVGGGLIRDIVLGNIPPGMFNRPVYTIVALIVSCIVFLGFYIHKGMFDGNTHETYDRILLVMDSVGLGIFTVVGVNTGIQAGYMDQTFLLVFLGTITGVGGGLLRDMMAGVPPYIFVRHVYACASIVGAIACVYIYRIMGGVEAMIGASTIVILIRYLAAHYHWNLPRLGSND